MLFLVLEVDLVAVPVASRHHVIHCEVQLIVFEAHIVHLRR